MKISVMHDFIEVTHPYIDFEYERNGARWRVVDYGHLFNFWRVRNLTTGEFWQVADDIIADRWQQQQAPEMGRDSLMEYGMETR